MKGFLYGQTCYDLMNNSIRLDEYVKLAKDSGFDFLSITDPNMYASYKFYKLCKANDIKPIIGLEYNFYNDDSKESKLLIYAKNNKGLRNLFKITTRVLKDKINNLYDVLEYDNLYFIFVFEKSYLYRLFKMEEYQVLNDYLKIIENNHAYIGYSFTNDLSKIRITNDFLDYIYDKDIKILPLHNTKYLIDQDKIVYEALSKMNEKEVKITEEMDYSFLDNPTLDEELDSFINSIEPNLFSKVTKTIPKFPNTKGYESFEYLRALCHKGLEKRGYYDKIHVERLEYELNIINRMGYSDYFLIVWDFIRYAKTHNILVGPGRGSAAGSLCAYTLGITEVEPLKYGLLFERFLNPERVSMPDIDTDFPDDKRDEVIKYVKDLYGDLHVSYITTFQTFQLKSSVKELSKCFNIVESRASTLIDMILKNGYEKLINEYKGTDLEKFLYAAMRLENLPKHTSTHAAGIIMSYDNLDDIIPLQGGLSSLYQSQFEYSDLEDIGLLKMDFLGIRNLTMLKNMMDLVPGFDMAKLRNIPLNDKKVYNLFSNADTLGVFQFESVGIRKVLRDIKPSSFDDLVAIIALYRPGPMESIPEYSARKKGKRFEYLHKDLEPILKDTYGIIVYQEQVMLIAQKIAGFSLAEADTMRKAISKKKAELMDKLEIDFVNGAIKKGYSKELALNIYNLILKFANYGFNKSHAVVYSLLAYQIAYFKANYFYAFIINILNNTIGNSKSMVDYINYAKVRGMVIKEPDINYSSYGFTYHNNMIYMPFTVIKNIGTQQSKMIIDERIKNGPYKSYADFKARCILPASIMEALVFSGSFDSFNITKKNLMESKTKQDDIFFKHMNVVVDENDEYEFSKLQEMEYKYLSINIKYNIFKDIDKLCYNNRALKINMLKYNYSSMIIAAFVKIKVITTKNKEEMVISDISDGTNLLRGVIFSKAYSLYKNMLIENKLFKLRGILKQDKEVSFIINDIYEI